jgi:hypothetical protein
MTTKQPEKAHLLTITVTHGRPWPWGPRAWQTKVTKKLSQKMIAHYQDLLELVRKNS